jgi:DNA-directed RNA polymerase I, II, and III subunit RPABC3
MTSLRDNILFSDQFQVHDVDKDGKKFDRVSRINAKSEQLETTLLLDVNNQLYPMAVEDKFTLVLVQTLSLDPTMVASGDAGMQQRRQVESWRDVKTGNKSLADDYEYVMHGKVYKVDDAAGSRVAVFVSFGGLLLCLEGEYRHLQNIQLAEHVYLLMRTTS